MAVVAGKKIKILVIDDSFMVRRSLVEQLSGNRFEVFEAKDGPSGLTQAVEVNPDVILLDYVMPGMNGFEVYQALRQQSQFANTPVIVISSSRDEVIKKFGQPFVGFDFLPKQFTRQQLEERIDALIPHIDDGGKSVSGEDTILPRLDQIENRMMQDMGGLQQRLEQVLNRTSSPDRMPELIERLTHLENRLGSLSQGSPDRTSEVLDRIGSLENRLSYSPPDRTGEVLERLSGLEQRLGYTPPDRTQEVLDRLGSLEQRLGYDRTQEILERLNTGATDRTGEVLERLGSLENRIGYPTPDRTDEVLSRLGSLEQRIGYGSTDRTDEVLSRLGSLEQRIGYGSTDRTNEVLDRINSMEQRLQLPDRTEEVLSRLGQMGQVEKPNLDPVVNRLNAIETKLGSVLEKTGGQGLSEGSRGGGTNVVPIALGVINIILLVFLLVRG